MSTGYIYKMVKKRHFPTLFGALIVLVMLQVIILIGEWKRSDVEAEDVGLSAVDDGVG